MPVAFGTDISGRRIDIRPKGWTSDGKYELLLDGEVVSETKPKNGRVEVSHGDVTVKAKLTTFEQSIRWAEATVGEGESVPLDPEPGSRQAKLEEYAVSHPKLYAARHVVVGIGKVVIPILGVGLVFNLLPSFSVPTPDVSLPSFSIPFPEIHLPDLPALPGWVQTVADSLKFVTPVLIGVWLARREYIRRKETEEKKKRAAQGDSADS